MPKRRAPQDSEPSADTMCTVGSNVQCPICLDGIWPCQSIKLSFCHPIQHVAHWDCWWDQTDEQQEHCSVCRQHEVSRPTAFMIYNHFPARGLSLSFGEMCGEPSMQWFNSAGQGLVQSFVRGDLTKEDLIRIAHAIPDRGNMDACIQKFISQAQSRAIDCTSRRH